MNPQRGLTKTDWIAAAVLWAATVAVFAAGSARLGFYFDDNTWIVEMESMNLARLPGFVASYIPGRNLFPVWQYILYKMAGDPVSHLAAMHVVQSILDGAAVAAFFFLLRMLALPASASVIASGLFSFWPIHGETHFWHTSLGANLLPALFSMLFAMTSLALVREQGVRRRWWLSVLDLTLFYAALLTYDQGILVLLGILGVRATVVLWNRRAEARGFLLAQLLYIAGILWWAKLRVSPTSSPKLGSDALNLLRGNIPVTASSTFGRFFWQQMKLLLVRMTLIDAILAVVAAGAIVVVAIWVMRQPRPEPRGRMALLAGSIAFYVAAYLPIWLWHLAPRHHYLPSIGLFAGAAVGLAWILDRLTSAALRAALIIALGGVTCIFAAAGRGESRFWEQSFIAKKQLLLDLGTDLAKRPVLALVDFPSFLGPAYFIVPHDAEVSPRIFFPALGRRRFGDTSAAAAPGGIFLRTRLSGAEDFRYFPEEAALVVRFAGWDHDRLRFAREAPTPRYRVQSSIVEQQSGPFGVQRAQAHREGDDLAMALEVDVHLPPGQCLAATLSVFQHGGFHRWIKAGGDRALYVQPLALSPDPLVRQSISARVAVAARVFGFPETEQVRVDFFAAGADAPPVHLGHAEMRIEP